MKNIKYILIFTVLIGSGKLFAQQAPTYSLYKYNMNIINPAYAGTNEHPELNLNIRSQWINLKNSPETQSLSFSKPINNKVGLGLSIVNDKIDIFKETNFTIDFSYKLQISDISELYLGVKAGGSTFSADYLSKGLGSDPAFSKNVNRFNVIFGTGAYLKVKKLYITLSSPNLINGKRVDKNSSGGYINATNKTYIYTGTGYEFVINENVKFLPSVMGIFVQGAPTSIDLTTIFDIYNKTELGISYRLNDSINGVALFKVSEMFQLGYAYDFTISDVKNFSAGTHEIMLRFNLNSTKK